MKYYIRRDPAKIAREVCRKNGIDYDSLSSFEKELLYEKMRHEQEKAIEEDKRFSNKMGWILLALTIVGLAVYQLFNS